MPSSRRLRILGLLIALGVIVTLYITSAAHQTRQSAFYVKTSEALAAQRAGKEAILGSHDHAGVGNPAPGKAGGVGARLKHAEEAAKEAADRKAEEFHGEEVVDSKRKEAQQLKEKTEEAAQSEKAADSTKPLNTAKDSHAAVDHEVAAGKSEKEDHEATKAENEDDGQSKVKEELNSILKKSPIIIFSKSYCPYSRKAKDILLHQYNISPSPFVVELDEHEIGGELQAELETITGRGTVPNILVNGKSIGGGDDIENLHMANKIAETVISLAGKRVKISAKSQE